MAGKSTLTQIREYFGLSVSDFTQEWRKMTDKDKADLKVAIESGTENY